jgi:hypothetical protein
LKFEGLPNEHDPQTAKSPARTAILPSHGSTNPGKEMEMNKDIPSTAQPRKPAAVRLPPRAGVSAGDTVIDLTPAEHEHTEAVILAAQWLAEQNPAPATTIPTLRSRFDLTAMEATEACALAKRYRTFRKAHG